MTRDGTYSTFFSMPGSLIPFLIFLGMAGIFLTIDVIRCQLPTRVTADGHATKRLDRMICKWTVLSPILAGIMGLLFVEDGHIPAVPFIAGSVIAAIVLSPAGDWMAHRLFPGKDR